MAMRKLVSCRSEIFRSYKCTNANTDSSCETTRLSCGWNKRKSVLHLVFTPWHFFLFVLLRQTIGVTFRGILHCREEWVMVAMTECFFDWRRGARWGDGRARKLRTRRWDWEKITSRPSHLITNTVGLFSSDIFVSGISSVFWIFVISRQQMILEDTWQIKREVACKFWSPWHRHARTKREKLRMWVKRTGDSGLLLDYSYTMNGTK